MQFQTLTFTEYPSITLPQSVILEYPAETSLPAKDHHFLLYIPWQKKFLQLVPKKFQTFFSKVLPHLSARTTDVHTANCCQYIQPLCYAVEAAHPGRTIDQTVVTLALILHDCGWSRLSEKEVAASLGVSGLKLNATALGPKEKHAVEGVALATELLESYGKSFSLSEAQKDLILLAIRHHDQPEKVAKEGTAVPLEVQVLVDLDHLWSFTQLNFWQDVYRKGINNPQTYLENLQTDLDSYFVTPQGRALATRLWKHRQEEVAQFPTQP
ncbi:MAG: HD domain-containing protein [Pseudomonadales bacterium]|nr:HD domain-containing protein [Pseudomonadales bacterium]